MQAATIKQDEVKTSIAINKLQVEQTQKSIDDLELAIYKNVDAIPQLKGKTTGASKLNSVNKLLQNTITTQEEVVKKE